MKILGVIYENKYYLGIEDHARVGSKTSSPSNWIVLKKPYLYSDGQLQPLDMLLLIVPEGVAKFIPSIQIMHEYAKLVDKKKTTSAKVVSIQDYKNKNVV